MGVIIVHFCLRDVEIIESGVQEKLFIHGFNLLNGYFIGDVSGEKYGGKVSDQHTDSNYERFYHYFMFENTK